jgi:hypothetical protein
LGEDADAWPVLSSSGVPVTSAYGVQTDPVEDEHDLHVGERLETSGGRLLQNLVIQFDESARRAPVVVFDLGSASDDASDRRYWCELHPTLLC